MGRRTGVLAALGALLSGCSPLRALDALVPGDTYRFQGGVAYGADPRHKLDVYQPFHRGPAVPVVVFFYGGNWARGSREEYRFVGEALAASGAVTLVADYRLSPQVRWTDILADCARAVKWAFDNADRLGGDASQVYVMGHSAGAYNAAMLALDGRWLAAQGLQPRLLAGWIGIAGPYDFLPIGDPETRVAFGWPDTPADSQPMHHVSADAPRALLLAARDDKVVNPQRSTVGLASRLQAAGATAQVELFDKVNHATVLGSLARPLNWLAPVLARVQAFVGLPGRA